MTGASTEIPGDVSATPAAGREASPLAPRTSAKLQNLAERARDYAKPRARKTPAAPTPPTGGTIPAGPAGTAFPPCRPTARSSASISPLAPRAR